MIMKARIIAIGNELLRGEIIDTNSSMICSCLRDLGITTVLQETIPDEEASIKESILNEKNADFVFVILFSSLFLAVRQPEM